MKFSQFESKLLLDCKTTQCNIAFPECRDKRILEAASFLLAKGCVAQVYFFFASSDLASALADFGLTLPSEVQKKFLSVPEVYPNLSEQVFECLEEAQKNKTKKKTRQELLSQASDPLFQAGYLLRRGSIQAVLAGAVATTAEVIRAALATVGLSRGCRTLSGAFLLLKNSEIDGQEQAYLYADSAVVVQPDESQLVDIAAEAVKTWQNLFGPSKAPRVAFLSFSTKGSASHAQAHKMKEAFGLFQQRFPHILADGELQFDAAIDAQISKRKAPTSPLAGAANIFIFPDLNSGNIAYKITERLAGFQAYGPLLQGLALPYSDLSRGAQVKDIIISTCILVILSTAKDLASQT